MSTQTVFFNNPSTITSLQSTTTSMSGSITNISSDINVINGQINSLQTTTTSMSGSIYNITSMSGSITNITSDINVINGQINALQIVDQSTLAGLDFTLYNYQTTGVFNLPSGPNIITAVNVTTGGINVAFNPVYASPKVRYYVISSGQSGACVTVEAKYSTTGATIPVLPGQDYAQISVEAVNEYGVSGVSVWPSILTGANLSAATPNADIRMIQLLEFSDFHGAIEIATGTSMGSALMASAFERDRSYVPATFTVSAGDNFGASPPISGQFEEIPTVECMNLMNVDVSAFGNHEHDRNVDHLKKMVSLSNFSWVAANYNTLAPLSSGAYTPTDYVILNRGGINVGFVGFNNQDTALTTAVGNLLFGMSGSTGPLNIYSDVNIITNTCEKAKRAGADIVVVLGHIGWSINAGATAIGDLPDYAKKIEGADVIFGAHSHQNYRSIYKGDSDNPYRLIGQATNSGQTYNRALITYNNSTKQILGMSISNISYSNVAALNLTPNPTIISLVQGYRATLAPTFDVFLNTVDMQFPGGGGANDRPDRRQEGYMGDFITDLIRARVGTDFAMVNGGGIRDTLPALGYTVSTGGLLRPDPAGGQNQTGPFSVVVGDAYTVFPFGNGVSIVTVTGKTVWSALNWGISGYPTNGRFPQVSGLRFSFNSTLKSVLSVTKADGTPIQNNDNQFYTFALPDYVVYGGDGYTMFNPATASFPGILFVDILIDKLNADRAANIVTQRPVLDGRISYI
jgi:5'-nucleotidase